MGAKERDGGKATPDAVGRRDEVHDGRNRGRDFGTALQTHQVAHKLKRTRGPKTPLRRGLCFAGLSVRPGSLSDLSRIGQERTLRRTLRCQLQRNTTSFPGSLQGRTHGLNRRPAASDRSRGGLDRCLIKFPSSFGFEARGLNDSRPLCDFAADERREMLRRVRTGVEPLRREQFARLRRCNSSLHFGVEPCDDV